MSNLLDMDVERILHNYPALFDNRDAVLNHMYCSYGTEWVWEERTGKLIDIHTPDLWLSKEEVLAPYFPRITPTEKEMDKFHPNYSSEILHSRKRIYEYFESIVDNAAALAQRVSSYPQFMRWEKMSEFSRLLTMPENVHLDYFEGAIEVAVKITLTPQPTPATVEMRDWSINYNFAVRFLMEHYARYRSYFKQNSPLT